MPTAWHNRVAVAFGLTCGFLLAWAGGAGSWSAQEEATQQEKSAEPIIELDSLLKALELASKNPEALERQLEAAIRETDDHRKAIEAQLEELKRRIDLLRQAGSLVGVFSDETKTPASVKNEEASKAGPAAPAKASVPEKSAAAEKSPALESDAAPEKAIAAEGTPVNSVQPFSASGFSEDQKKLFSTRFASEIWPMMGAGEGRCFKCHDVETKTPLRLLTDANQTFIRLLQGGYLDDKNPGGLMVRLTSPSDDLRMPQPPNDPWSEDELGVLRRFLDDLKQVRPEPVGRADERFPEELLEPFKGDENRKVVRAGNTFLTYYQLRKKIESIFGDDWKRNERDLFQENIHMFSGADFQIRFNESSTPTATFLTGMDLVAAAVASRSYLNRSGPFEGFPDDPPPPAAGMDAPDEAYRSAIGGLYRRILFRDPSETDLAESFRMIRAIYESHEAAKDGDYSLSFDLTVTGESGIPTHRSLSIQVRNSSLGLYQEFVDQNQGKEMELPRVRIGEAFTFKAGDDGQALVLSNHDTRGFVTFHALEIYGPLPGSAKQEITAESPLIKLRGPWVFRGGKVKFVDDGDQNKGQCELEIPIKVERDGRYALYLRLGKNAKRRYASRALVEVFSHGESRLLTPPLPEKPPPGEAHFFIDQTLDAIAFLDLKTSFRFDSKDHYVEINNKGTTKRVTADAMKFVPVTGGDSILIDNPAAVGREEWPVFTDYPFRPYNITGADTVSDQNKRKGELTIRYPPAIKEGQWKKETFYQVHVGFPGQVSNDPRVPVIVKAAASSPIVHLSHPRQAPIGARVEIDASASYDLEGSELKYEWNQIEGPRVEISDPHAAKIAFTTAPRAVEQAVWEGLATALIRHPDFMFTRPVSLAGSLSDSDRRRLQLVKIAQDLVARPPTHAELAKLEAGAGFGEMIDSYLASKEFEDFYFHRIRLYLESHGSEEDDEPTRLWSYIASNDRPFKEILTADYSVDVNMERRERPAHHGKTGLLTMKGFLRGKPGLPHFNYSAQVAEKFLGYIFEVPADIVAQREQITAAGTTDPTSSCYSCHKVLTPLAYQRLYWDDDGRYRIHDLRGLPIDASDRNVVPSYPFAGTGMEAFATSAQNKERFIRTIIGTHFTFFMGRDLRWEEDERELYHHLWTAVHESDFTIKSLIKAIMTSQEYLGEKLEPPGTEIVSHAAP